MQPRLSTVLRNHTANGSTQQQRTKTWNITITVVDLRKRNSCSHNDIIL